MERRLIKGSLQAISKQRNISLAESFLSCDTLLLVDMSSSMASKDAQDGKSRYDAAEADVVRLQSQYPGRVGLIVFASTVQFCPAGIPIRLGGGTELSKALQFVKVADDCDIQIIVISDGEPNDEQKCLRIAKTFTSKISTVFVGPEDDRHGGRAFLEKLAKATGGQSFKAKSPGLLAKSVKTLMLQG